ncbi:PIN domain-containing protein [Methermicoccus shengliensis]|uniref:DNA-binding protein n=1 Tax=Methermicoccus shengliensis TaxID=660064 RepID=A0A832VXW9_9EURY|nr:PIN domain-containing protein [Methermicoccus shengliensis]KUK04816.1 MAG: PilT domain protein [Euryarchaeota archaeon 55_53]KUK29574.1 MAG: PilT domain protein [Methanosarcinales archeaon 56_1174]MDI3487733.1 uncharacterized protein [Methanosarcinales archaeon]MDN5295501.1 uncharacterized protein [Methanosarcinales archaeon]HIH70262.1 DNA-binding protein [Methermicoccus shengliensis]
MSCRVIIDTSILMLAHTHKVDVLSELRRLGFTELFVPQGVLLELRGLSRRGGKEGVAARVALALAERCIVCPSPREVPIDDFLLELAHEMDAALATSDSELRKRARKAGIALVGMRGLDHLERL